MKSPEKTLAFLERLQAFTDEEISEALGLPIPAPMLRGALAMVAPQISTNAEELDESLTRLGEFVLDLRSDHEPAATH